MILTDTISGTGPCSGKFLTQFINLKAYLENFEIIGSFNTGRLKMPALQMNYLVIFKAYCEFTGVNDVLNRSIFYYMLCKKKK